MRIRTLFGSNSGATAFEDGLPAGGVSITPSTLPAATIPAKEPLIMVELCRVRYNAIELNSLHKYRLPAARNIDPVIMFLINTPQ